MSRLRNHIGYLAGSIDKSNDYGRGWRTMITPFLQHLDIGVFDPCDKPVFNTTVHEDKNFVQNVQDLKDCGNYDEVERIMQEIVRIDLNFVDLANFIILNIVPDVHMCGSYAEQTIACMQRKPVIVHCDKGISNIPNWLFGVCDHNMFFDNWDDVKSYIEHICFSDEVDDNDKKWRFIDYDKAFNR